MTRWFNDMGLYAIAVEGDIWSEDIQNCIGSAEYKVNFTSPDIALDSRARSARSF
ncbi:hypothetical protein F5880DRAFT_1618822 [Lentinula raphanica]|nr:hypothetical protein F5880DRAFT_1618822 [Lentinula raphanica]